MINYPTQFPGEKEILNLTYFPIVFSSTHFSVDYKVAKCAKIAKTRLVNACDMPYQKVQEYGYSIQERGLHGNFLIDCFCRENIENNCNISHLECHSTKMFAEHLRGRSTSPVFEEHNLSRFVIITL